MGQIDVSRIRTYEEENTFISPSLDGVLKEIDTRLTAANCFASLTYTDDLISKIEYFSDQAKTKKVSEITISRTNGDDNIAYITGLVNIFYNAEGSEDSRVVSTLMRDSLSRITGCDNIFSTSEAIC